MKYDFTLQTGIKLWQLKKLIRGTGNLSRYLDSDLAKFVAANGGRIHLDEWFRGHFDIIWNDIIRSVPSRSRDDDIKIRVKCRFTNKKGAALFKLFYYDDIIP